MATAAETLKTPRRIGGRNDIPFAVIRLKSPPAPKRPFPAQIGNARAAAEFMKEQITDWTPLWRHAAETFNSLSETRNFTGFRTAFIAALQSEGWNAKQFAKPAELQRRILTEVRKYDGSATVIGITIIRPSLKAWDIAITRSGANIDDQAWAIAREVANDLLNKYDLDETEE